MRRNLFLTAALEELNQPASAEPAVTEVNIDQSLDAVAALMKKNTELATENCELQAECFDNDTDVVNESSAGVQQDLEAAVQAGAALEELAHLAQLTVKSGMANKASVAGLAFALEQISRSAGLPSAMAGLEDSEDKEPAEQAADVGEKAKEMSQTIGQRLMQGIKRIFQWLMSFFRNLFTRTGKLADKAKELKARVEEIDESKKITDAGFIKSLRIPTGNDSIADYYHNFRVFSNKGIAYFGKDFIGLMEKMHKELIETKTVTAPWDKVIRPTIGDLQRELFPYEPKAGTVTGVPKEVDIWVSPRLVGGVQLFLAFNDNVENIKEVYFKVGRAVDPELRADESIEVLSREDASDLLEAVENWMRGFRDLEKSMKRIERIGQGHTNNFGSFSTTYNHLFITMLSGMTMNTLPHILNLTMFNAQRIMTYVEKSIAASGGKKE